MDPLHLLSRLQIPLLARCRVPSDLESVTSVGGEVSPRDAGVPRAEIHRVVRALESLYRTGVYPAVQLCILRRGRAALHRALGHASGNAPGAAPGGPVERATVETPFNIFSASKAITAMVVHKLDDRGLLHIDDRVCDYIPEFARHGKEHITIRHILGHRAGIPNLPPHAIDLALLAQPQRVMELLCEARPRTRPGRILAYHAVSGGFVLGEVVRRVAGEDIRSVLSREICEPLGLRWMRYGVDAADVPKVAENAFTGPPVPPPLAQILRRALGAGMREVVELSNDPRFLTGIIPSGNVVTTAAELAAFYQCLLDGGELSGARVFDSRTIRRATSEQSYWELDLTLGVPLRYGLGFMLGGEWLSPFGYDNPLAFGHLGFTNVFSWADPERRLAVALLTSGKPVLSAHAVRVAQLLAAIHRAFPKIPRAAARSLRSVRGARATTGARGPGRSS